MRVMNRGKVGWMACGLPLWVGVVAAQIPTQHFVFPQIAVGGGWETEITLVAQGADRSGGLIGFYAGDGSHLFVNVDGSQGRVQGFSYDLAPRESRTFVLTAEGGAKTGFAQSQIVDSIGGAIGAVATYRLRSEDGEVLAQVGVPPSARLWRAQLPFDNRDGNRTGFAFATGFALPSTGNSLVLRRYDESGTLQESASLSLPDRHQHSAFVDEIFPASAGQQGYLALEPTEPLYFLALNLNGTILSTSAVLPGVLARDLRMSFLQNPPTTDPLWRWRLHLMQDGALVTGLGWVFSPLLGATVISGQIIRSHPDHMLVLHINFQMSDRGTSCILSGRSPATDWSLINGHFLCTSESSEMTSPDTLMGGTFLLTPAPNSQF